MSEAADESRLSEKVSKDTRGWKTLRHLQALSAAY